MTSINSISHQDQITRFCIFLFFSLCFFFSSVNVYSQCTPLSSFFYGEILPNGSGTCASTSLITADVVVSDIKLGEYFRIPVLNGGRYRISTCGGASNDTELTGILGFDTFHNDDNGPACNSTEASFDVTATSTQYLYVNLNEFSCQFPNPPVFFDQVTVNQINNLSFTSSSADMCQGEARTLTATPAAVGDAPPNSGDYGTFSGTGVSGSLFTAPVPAGDFTDYTMNYCFAYLSTTQDIRVYKFPSTANAGANQNLTGTTSTTMAANTPTAGTGAWSLISGTGSIVSPGSPTTTINGLSDGANVFRWTISNGPCVASTSDVTINVQSDIIDPVITCPASITQANDAGACGATVTYPPPTATDNDGVKSITQIAGLTSGAFFPLGITTNTFVAEDTVGNTDTCSFDVTATDTTKPVVDCSGINPLRSADANLCSFTMPGIGFDPIVSDNCPGVKLSNDFNAAASLAGETFPVGTTNVLWTATDTAGNTSTCSIAIVISDDESPVVNCAGVNGSKDAPPGQCGFTMPGTGFDPAVSENCAIDNIVNDYNNGSSLAGETFPVGSTDVEWIATDTSGNADTCIVTIIISDTTDPIALCKNVTVVLNAGGSASITALDVDSGSNDACGIGSLIVSPNSFTCGDVGNNPVTLTVNDMNGNSSTCNPIVTVEDNSNPTVTCILNVGVPLSPSGSATITFNDVVQNVNDNCSGSLTYTLSQSSFTCSDVGLNTVTVTAMDPSGNSSTPCNATVDVQDNTDPVAVCQNITIQLDSAYGADTIAGIDLDNGSTDACGIASYSSTQSIFGCADEGIVLVTLTVTDSSGNTSSCNSTVTVEDNVPPVAVCQDITIQLDATGNASISGGDIDSGSSDACGIASLVASPNSFNCGNVGSNSVTLTVTDNNGNTDNCSANVSVEDTVSPMAICQNITVQLNASGTASITGGDVDNGSSDACGLASLDAAPNTFACADAGPNTVVLTVTDNNGNSDTCHATVMIQDNVTPTALCQNITIQLDGTGNTSIEASDVDNNSTDACGIDTLSVNPNTFNCSNTGSPVTVTLTATDASGNSDNCTAHVTVEDTIPPVASCQDITIQLDASGNASISGGDIDDGSSDACGILSFDATPNAFTCSEVGPNAVVLTATDNNGNSDTCHATVTVADTVPPAVLCQNITVELDSSGNASISSDVVSSVRINCGNGPAYTTVDGRNFQSDVFFLTGNTFATGTPIGGTLDDALYQSERWFPASAGVNAGYDIPVFNGDYYLVLHFAEIFSGISSSGQRVFDVTGEGNLLLDDFDIYDEVGPNFAVIKTQTISVTDGVLNIRFLHEIENPKISAIEVVSVGTSVNASATDACGIDTSFTNPSSFSCSNVGNNAVTLTVTDVNGNSNSCNAIVTVEDNIAPQALCQDITVQLDATGNASIEGSDVDNGSNDACGIDTLTVSPNMFNCSDVGPNTVTMTATDNNGNSSNCNATVTVEDNVAPVAICEDITVQLDASGDASINTGDVDSGSTDACGIQSLSIDSSDFDCSEVGANAVTLTVTDNNNNVSTCAATVTIEDNVNPVAQCQNITIQLDNSGSATADAADVDNGSSDACGIDTLTLDESLFNCDDVGSNPVTLTVTDNNGNTDNCSATVTVEDNVAPVLSCPATLTVPNDTGFCSAQVNGLVATAADNCPGTTITNNSPHATAGGADASGNYPVGTTVVTFIATDASGNMDTCSMSVTVADNENPIASCFFASVALNQNGTVTVPWQIVNNNSFDNCGVASISLSPKTFNCSNVGQNQSTLTVTDVNGNVNTCNTTITIQDNIAPMAMCQDITVELDSNGNHTIDAMAINNGSTDACGIASFSSNPATVGCGDVGTVTAILSVTDVGGNTDTCSASVTIEDNIAPAAICQDLTVELDSTGNASISSGAVNNGSNDACGIDTMTLDNSSFTCGDVGANSVILTVTDNNGNSSTCGASVTVEDNIAPLAVCQDITVQLDSAGNASITATNVDGGSSDACGIDTTTIDISSFDCNNSGTVAYTSFEEPALFSGQYTDLGPDSVDHALATNAGEPLVNYTSFGGELGFSSFYFNTRSSNGLTDGDFVGVTSFTGTVGSYTNGSNGFQISDPDGTMETTLDAVDISAVAGPSVSLDVFLQSTGWESDDVVRVYVVFEDNTELDLLNTSGSDIDDLSIEGSWMTLSGSLAGHTSATLKFALESNSSSEALYVDNIRFTGGTLVTLTVTDNNGNSSTCTSSVTVEDNIAPSAICQDLTVQLDSNGSATILPGSVNNGSSDACGLLSISLDNSNFGCADVGSNGVTLTVTDNNNNSSNCSSTITVEDNVAPVALCQDLTIQLDSTGNATISTGDINNGSSDACGIQGMSLDQSSFVCGDIGSNSVILTVTDNNGNQSSCGASVTVEDNIAPQALCQDITVQLGIFGSASITANDVDGGSNDACGIQSTGISTGTFSCANVGANPVTLSVSDVNGNSSSCIATVTVEDTLPPTSNCRDFTVQLDASGSGTLTVPDVDDFNFDNCFSVTKTIDRTAFDCSDIGQIAVVTLTLTDNNGNVSSCTGNISTADVTEPIAVCQDITVSLDSSGSRTVLPSMINNGSSDACGIESMALDTSMFNCSDVGINSVELSITDSSGNTGVCDATVTVLDDIIPAALCQDITVYLDNNGQASVSPATLDAGSNDACGLKPIVAEDIQYQCNDVGPNAEILTVEDLNGNMNSCNATVTVQDTTGPNAMCKDITVSLNNSGTATITASMVDNGSNDACGTIGTSIDQSSFTCSDAGSNTVTLTVTDVNSNTSTCTSNVTVQDSRPPTAVCFNGISVSLDQSGQVVVPAALINNNSFDNCGVTSISLSPDSFTCDDLGDNLVALTVFDNAGLSNFCQTTIEIQDNFGVCQAQLCDTVTGLSTTNISYRSATLNWNVNSNAVGYEIRGRRVGSANTVTLTVNGGSTTSKNVQGLTQSTQYEWQIRPICEISGTQTNGPWSPLTTFTTLTCQTPTGLTTNPIGTTTATLNWNQVAGATGYKIRGRRAGSSQAFVTLDVSGGANTSRNVSGLAAGQTYEWQVQSSCGQGVKSAYSALSFFTTNTSRETQALVTDGIGFENPPLIMDVYPNPNEGRFNVRVENIALDQPFDLIVYDILGRVVIEQVQVASASEQTISLDLSDKDKGTYILVIRDKDRREEVRVIVQ